WVGVGLGILSVPAAYWVFSSIGQNVSETVLTKEHHELVTHGPYHWIRHPLYTMGLALLGGIGLMAANWFILLYCLVALIAVRMVVIPREESALIATFGDRYRDYMGRTGAMVPKLMGRS
ncbi:MAG: isoprenylcysteine carboxylmethyltransferase family protein, partial [Gemmatimonadota bacterium]|nr:isoprenylcysteine carboxylmethyltransferase family protein [Gemmatimonadota bacterium]